LKFRQLIKATAETCGLPEKEVRRVYEAMVANIAVAVQGGDEVTLQNLGAIRQRVHPNFFGTGERRHTLRFHVSENFSNRTRKPRSFLLDYIDDLRLRGLGVPALNLTEEPIMGEESRKVRLNDGAEAEDGVLGTLTEEQAARIAAAPVTAQPQTEAKDESGRELLTD
tara:strand:- start:610 stop:1113 length:504 start_codon:yes stop_codon:yes gene_type:complete